MKFWASSVYLEVEITREEVYPSEAPYLTFKPSLLPVYTGARLVASNDKVHGYLTLTVDGQSISGTATTVADLHNPVIIDRFQYPVAAQFLPAGVVVSL